MDAYIVMIKDNIPFQHTATFFGEYATKEQAESVADKLYSQGLQPIIFERKAN